MYYFQPSSQLIPQTMRKTNGVRSKKLDKDRFFTWEQNPRRVSKMIYSCELIPRAIQTLFWDRYTISAKQPPMPLESTHDPTTKLGCSDTTCCACGATTNEESINRDRCSEKVPACTWTKKQERKHANTKFNEVQQFAYVLGVREREILLIQ